MPDPDVRLNIEMMTHTLNDIRMQLGKDFDAFLKTPVPWTLGQLASVVSDLVKKRLPNTPAWEPAHMAVLVVLIEGLGETIKKHPEFEVQRVGSLLPLSPEEAHEYVRRNRQDEEA